MAERVVFKGLLNDQVAALPRDEFLRLIPSRARRAIKRNSFKYKQLCQKVKDSPKEKEIKTHIREAVILPEWIGRKFLVHNGKEFYAVEIKSGMIGHRLGEFSPSTKRVQHSAPGIKATRGSKFLSVK